MHKWVRKLGERASEEQQEDREAVFERGQTLPSQMRRSRCLFMEADGAIVHLQRERERRGEVKIGLSYESWDKRAPGSKEWTLVNRRVVAGVFLGEGFWQAMTVDLARRYDLSSIEYEAVNGDAAGWVNQGKEYFKGVERQADRFHLYRDIRRVYGKQGGSLVQLLARGEVKALMDTIEATVDSGKTAKENKMRRALFASLQKRADTLLD